VASCISAAPAVGSKAGWAPGAQTESESRRHPAGRSSGAGRLRWSRAVDSAPVDIGENLVSGAVVRHNRPHRPSVLRVEPPGSSSGNSRYGRPFLCPEQERPDPRPVAQRGAVGENLLRVRREGGATWAQGWDGIRPQAGGGCGSLRGARWPPMRERVPQCSGGSPGDSSGRSRPVGGTDPLDPGQPHPRAPAAAKRCPRGIAARSEPPRNRLLAAGADSGTRREVGRPSGIAVRPPVRVTPATEPFGPVGQRATYQHRSRSRSLVRLQPKPVDIDDAPSPNERQLAEPPVPDAPLDCRS
jgi:hypothetical protein